MTVATMADDLRAELMRKWLQKGAKTNLLTAFVYVFIPQKAAEATSRRHGAVE